MRSIYTPKHTYSSSHPKTIDFGSADPLRHSIESFLQPLAIEAEESDYLYYSPVGQFSHGRDSYRLARYVFLGPAADDEPIRLGIFATIHGDEPEGGEALIEFLRRLHRDPERARGYQIFAYPVCNPSGFEDGTHHSRSGHDLNHEFWKGSLEPEVYYIERELGVIGFHGVVALHAGGRANGIYAYARAATLKEALLEPAMRAAERFLTRAAGEIEEPCLGHNSESRKCHEGVLSNPSELKPAPFEIVFETPQIASPALQREATVAALDQVVANYRPFIATQQNI